MYPIGQNRLAVTDNFWDVLTDARDGRGWMHAKIGHVGMKACLVRPAPIISLALSLHATMTLLR